MTGFTQWARAPWRGGCRPASGPPAREDLPCDRGRAREHEQDAGDDDLRLGGDVLEAHHVLQRAEQEHARDRPAERALAAVEVDAAQEHGGDDGQFEAGGVVVAGAGG